MKEIRKKINLVNFLWLSVMMIFKINNNESNRELVMKFSECYVLLISIVSVALLCTVLSACVSPTGDMLHGATNKTANTAIDSITSSIVDAV